MAVRASSSRRGTSCSRPPASTGIGLRGPAARMASGRATRTRRLDSAVVSGTAERQELWGGETAKAVANFPVSGEPIPAAVAHWLGRIKAAAARANADLGLLDPDLAQRIAAAGDRIAAGELDDQFPIDVFQTGLGDELEHERERGDRRARRRGRPPERPRQHGPVVERRLPVCRPPRGARSRGERPAPGARAARARARGEGEGVRRHRQVGPHPPDGCSAGDARAGVLGLRGAGAPGDRPRRRTPCRASARSRSAARRPARA